jgi:hypothetical protein
LRGWGGWGNTIIVYWTVYIHVCTGSIQGGIWVCSTGMCTDLEENPKPETWLVT